MRSGRGDPQPIIARDADDLAAQTDHFPSRLAHVLADRRADLDDRLVHLALDLILQPLLPLGEQLLNVGSQLARLWVDDLKLLFDAEGEARLRHVFFSLS